MFSLQLHRIYKIISIFSTGCLCFRIAFGERSEHSSVFRIVRSNQPETKRRRIAFTKRRTAEAAAEHCSIFAQLPASGGVCGTIGCHAEIVLRSTGNFRNQIHR